MNYCPPPPPASGSLVPQYQPQQQPQQQAYVPQPQQNQQQQQISPCYWGPQCLPQVKVTVEINQGPSNWKEVLELQKQKQQEALGKDVVFRILAPPLFANFPVQITMKDGNTVEDLIKEVCKQTNNPREVIKGLRVHQSNKYANQSQKDDNINDNTIRLYTLSSGYPQPIELMARIKPKSGMRIDYSDTVQGFGKWDQVKGTCQLADTICAMLNTKGGVCLLGMNEDHTIGGQALHDKEGDKFADNLNYYIQNYIEPKIAAMYVKAKKIPMADTYSQGYGRMIEVVKPTNYDLLFTSNNQVAYFKGFQVRKQTGSVVVKQLQQLP